MDVNKILNSFFEDSIDVLCKERDSIGSNNRIEEVISCSELKECYTNHNNLEDDYKNLFSKLRSIGGGPALYWFKIESETKNDSIIDALEKYNNKENHRKVPYYNKSYNKETKVLYVGKCKKNIYTRIIQHLGYYKTASTQGLQLYHWAKDINLTVSINVIGFSNEMKDIVSIAELYLAKVLNPLLGRYV